MQFLSTKAMAKQATTVAAAATMLANLAMYIFFFLNLFQVYVPSASLGPR